MLLLLVLGGLLVYLAERVVRELHVCVVACMRMRRWECCLYAWQRARVATRTGPEPAAVQGPLRICHKRDRARLDTIPLCLRRRRRRRRCRGFLLCLRCTRSAKASYIQ